MSSETRQHLSVTEVNDVAVVTLTTPEAVFQTKDVQELDDELVRLIVVEKRSRLVLNLGGVRYLSSNMLVRLISLKKRVDEAQGRLALCCLAPVMRDTFRVSKLDNLFEIHDDEAAALRTF